jgi:hypothetical protein
VFYQIKKNLWLIVLFFIPAGLYAQKGLAGQWRGKLTYGSTSYPIEIYLQLEGKKITGRTYLEIERGKVLTMAIFGQIFDDRSGSLEEFEFLPTDVPGLSPPFMRKYQFVYKRSIWESTIEGFWQEILEDPLDTKRAMGRILLSKAQEPSSKA